MAWDIEERDLGTLPQAPNLKGKNFLMEEVPAWVPSSGRSFGNAQASLFLLPFCFKELSVYVVQTGWSWLQGLFFTWTMLGFKPPNKACGVFQRAISTKIALLIFLYERRFIWVPESNNSMVNLSQTILLLSG